EDEKVGLRHDRAGHGDAAFFASGKSFNSAGAVRAIEMSQCDLDAPVEGPTVERGDALLQFSMPSGFRGKGFEFGDELEHVLRSRSNVSSYIEGGIQGE